MSKRTLQRLGAIAIGLVLPLLVLEAGIRLFLPDHSFLDRRGECFWILRLDDWMKTSKLGRARLEVDPLLGWAPRSSATREGETTNSVGMRGSREFTREKPTGVRRIAVLGDSFTFGLDVDDDETYCAKLERELPGFEVLNFGVNGYGTDQQYLRWKRDVALFDPDIVLLGFFLPDVDRNLLSVREMLKPRFVLEGDELRLIEPPSGSVREHVEGLRRDCRSTSRVLDLLGYLRRGISDPEDPRETEHKARLALAILARFQAEVRANGSRFAVLVIPHPRQLADPAQLALTRAIEESGRREGFPVLDLTPLLVEQERAHPERPLYGDSEHFNVAGHALAATWIAEFLRGQGWL
jgi:lysophospholipase L1-like esterase